FCFGASMILAVVLTITESHGQAANQSGQYIPIPCALNSVLALEYRFNGSILSLPPGIKGFQYLPR
ncbi:MAG: hypothetical protein WDO71_02110, partial [Bacteroidota bacterium]